MLRSAFHFVVILSVGCVLSSMGMGQNPDLSVDALIEGMQNRANTFFSADLSVIVKLEFGPRNGLTEEDNERILTNAEFYSRKSSELSGREVHKAKERRGKFLQQYREILVGARYETSSINYGLAVDREKCRLEVKNFKDVTATEIYIEDGEKSIRYEICEHEEVTFPRIVTIDDPGAFHKSVQDRLELEGLSGQMPPRLLEYLDKHRNDVQLEGAESVEGMTVYVLSVEIPHDKQFSAFSGVKRCMFCGSTARMWVAPELGFVVPKIQVRCVNDVLAKEFVSEEFRELSPGIWFPLVTKRISYYEDGEHVSFKEVREVNDAKVNVDIPDDAFTIDLLEQAQIRKMLAKMREARRFIIELPDGTRIEDRRTPPPRKAIDEIAELYESGMKAHLEADHATALEKLQDCLSKCKSFKTRWPNDSRVAAVSDIAEETEKAVDEIKRAQKNEK